MSGHTARYYSPSSSPFPLSSPPPPYLFSCAARSPFLSVYSLFLFSLCTSRSSSRPRSRVHSTADFPVPADPSAPRLLTNMAAVRPLPSFAAPVKRRTVRNSRFAHSNPSYSPYAPTLDFIREISLVRGRRVQTLRLPSIDSDQFKERSPIADFLLFKRWRDP